jgi:hypothetical protein
MANITNLVQEPFASTAVRTPSNPGNLGGVTANFYGAAIGPSLTTATIGWSAIIEGSLTVANVYHLMSVPASSGATTNVLFAAWYYFDSLSIPSGKTIRIASICNSLGSGSNTDFEVDVNPTGGLNTQYYNDAGAAQANIMQCPTNNWFEIYLVDTVSGANHIAQVYAQTNGVFVAIGNPITFAASSSTFTYAGGGSQNVSASPFFIGRYGMPTLCALGYSSDATSAGTDYSVFGYPILNANQPTRWYVSSATGNDSNTGLFGQPWRTFTNLNAMLNEGGVFWYNGTTPGGGDIVTIDNTVPLNQGTNEWYIKPNGINLNFINGPIVSFSTIATGSWTTVSGYPNCYQTTDGGSPDMLDIVLWENNIWLTHPTGVNWAAVASTVESTAGSFFCDDDTGILYVHTIDTTDPATDENSYTRSHNFGLVGGSAIIIDATNVYISGLTNSKTTIATMTANAGGTGYGLEFQGGGYGTDILVNCGFDYGSKHLVGRTTQGTNMMVIRSNVTYGACSPYNTIPGATSADVDYCSPGIGNSYEYINCVQSNNIGIIGGLEGIDNTISSSWLSHSSGVKTNVFNYGLFKNCYFCGGIDEQGVNVGGITFTNTTAFYIRLGCPGVVNSCKTTGGPICADNTNCYCLFCTNDIMQINFAGVSQYYWTAFCGTQYNINCTIDTRQSTSGTGRQRSIYGWAGPSGLIQSNTAFLVSSGSDYTLLYNFSSNDIVTLGTNLYQLGSGNLVVKNYSNSQTGANFTFSSWQEIGKDVFSINTSSALFNTNEYPLADSSAIGAGQSLGTFPDYTGIVYNPRNTIGAYQSAGTNVSAYPMIPIFIDTTNGQFGASNGQFQFTVTGVPGSNAIVQGSTNLQTWLPLATNPLSQGSFTFTDKLATNYSARFYRVLLSP